jgi:putative ABC transport system permease protein
MIVNYLKIIFRNISRKKFYSIINIAGLSVGLITALLMIMYIVDEFSYDSFHEHADEIFRVNLNARLSGQEMNTCYTSAPLASGFVREIPEVEDATRIVIWSDISVQFEDMAYTESKVLLADSNYFDFFSFKLIQGDPKTVLKEPNTIVLTESAANKYFGYSGTDDNSTIGKMLYVGANRDIYMVTGICEDPPSNSHFHYSMIISMESWEYSRNQLWAGNQLNTYVRLNKQSDWQKVEDKFPELVKKYIGPLVPQILGISYEEFIDQGSSYGFYLQPLLRIHLHPLTTKELEPAGNIKTIYILGTIVIFIIFIACINFMNLSTASFTSRAREVGIRKTAGSTRQRLVLQFLSESVFLTFLSMILSIIITIIILPQFNWISGKQLSAGVLFSLPYLVGILLLIIIVGLLSGSYPAFYLTSFKPIEVMRGQINAGMKSGRIRSILVVFQFIISIVLIISSILIYKQNRHIYNKNPGFNKENLMVIRNVNTLGTDKQPFKEEILKLPDIVGASFASLVPPDGGYNDIFLPRGGDNQEHGFNYIFVDQDYFTTMGLKIAEGRFFSRDFPSDSTAVVINESTVQLVGWDQPLGEQIQTFWEDENTDVRNIVGVVKDFNFQSFRKEISSLLVFLGTQGNFLIVRLSPGNPDKKINQLEKYWKSFAGGAPFDYSFVNDDFNSYFRKEQQMGKIVLVFTCLAIFIACLGLFGLATFTVEQRTKEIGIRKTQGATVYSIIRLLSQEYLKLVSIAFIISIPVSYYLISWWLINFPYRINIGLLSFLAGGLLTLIITVLTVTYQSVKAASRNPVDSLRYE